MYATFSPPASANGLPPAPGEKTARWLRYVLDHGHSLIAEAPGTQAIAGHAILARSGHREAELAVFVHQTHRRIGLGHALAAACVQYAQLNGYQRLWATASLANSAAIRMVRACGFRITSDRGSPDVELELLLQPAAIER
jgi:GNAT superfamily N-acetyltransferase